MVLEGVETRLRSAKSEQSDVPTNLTIEHLMPVSWGANWPLPDGVDERRFTENRNRIVHTVGNLTLINRKLNASLSNAPWESKKEGFMAYSVMTLNSELRTEVQWDEEAILTRSKRMAKLLCECWPGPQSEVWGL